jgi:hypothetical protein
MKKIITVSGCMQCPMHHGCESWGNNGRLGRNEDYPPPENCPLQDEPGWRPMETAPKDGTRIQLRGGFSGDHVGIGSWKGVRPPRWVGDNGYNLSLDPTGWQQLTEY